MRRLYLRLGATTGATTGASKGKAPVSSKPKIKPTGGLKKPGIKATCKF